MTRIAASLECNSRQLGHIVQLKISSRFVTWLCVVGIWSISFSYAVAQQIPSGFNVERYARIWERNPFTLEAPASPETRVSPFDKLFLASWLKEGSKEIILVQNSDTNEVQSITTASNKNNLRLVEIRVNPNPLLAEAVISDGKEQGVVKFRPYGQSSKGDSQTNMTGQASNPSNSPSSGPAAISHRVEVRPHPVYPGVPRIHSEGRPTPIPDRSGTRDKHRLPDPRVSNGS